MTKEQSKKIWRRVGKISLIVVAVLLAIVLILVAVFAILYYKGRASLLNRDSLVITPPESIVDIIEDEGKTVVYKGETYRFNENAVSLLFMGIDKQGIDSDTTYGNNGQADSLFLAVIDTKTGKTNIIPISRESMVDVNRYTVNGTYAGVEKTQLCLAYAYANNAKDGCENVIRSVGRILYGMPIDGYVAIDMDGVITLNRAVGGVKVTVPEDLTVYPRPGVNEPQYLKKGQVLRLDDSNVYGYVRARGKDTDANNRRIQRQKQFLTGFIQLATQQIKADVTTIEKLYHAAEPYTVSSLDLSEITFLATTYVNSSGSIEYLTVQGETVMGEKHVEFYPDDTSLYEAILSAFYTKA